MWSLLLTLTRLAVGRSTDTKQYICGRKGLQSKIACAEKLACYAILLACYAMLLACYAMLLACTLLILDWHGMSFGLLINWRSVLSNKGRLCQLHSNQLQIFEVCHCLVRVNELLQRQCQRQLFI